MRPFSWLAGLLALAACSEPQQHPAETAAATSPPKLPAAPASFETSQVRILTLAQLPEGVALPAGKFVEAKEWADANGTNLLLITRTDEQDEPPAPDQAEGARHRELYARQYVRRNAEYQLLWKLQDNVPDCPFDISLGILPGSTAITDLDGDQHTETTLLYALGCRGDVSPLELKLIMHEDAAKYALRGNNIVPYDSVPARQRMPKDICCLDTVDEKRVEATGNFTAYDGRYHNEKDFRAAPPAFLRFARQEWRRWAVQPGPE